MRLGATSLNVTNRSGGGGSSSPTPTYSLSTNSSVNEGSNLVVNVTTQHVADGTNLYWSISHATTSNADFSAVSGTATVNSNSASFTITTVADATTETNPETFGIVVRTGSQSGPIVVQETSTNLNDTSQTPVATYTLAVNGGATSVDEGSSLTFDVEATNGNNTTVYWKITPGSTDPIVLSDFSSATNGSVTTDSSGQASFTITADADATSETDPEYFNVELHTVAAMNENPPAAEVTGLAVNDTSTDPTYALSTSNPAVDEGSSITFNFVTTNFPDQTLYWTVAGVATPTHGRSAASAADFNNVTSGSWSHTNGSSSFSVGPVADATTEGEEEFIVEVHTGSASGPVIADLEPVLINDTSLTPSWSMVSNNGTSEVDEGGSFQVDVTGTNIAGTPTPNWLIRSGGGSTVSHSEFSASSGTLSALTQNGTTWTGNFTINPTADNATEGDEIMHIDLYSDSSYGTQLTDVHGQPVSIGPITVRDTSLAKSATLSVSGSTAVDEGSTMTINVATTGYANGNLYWSVVGDGAYPVNPSVDFQGGDQGTAHLHNVTGTYGAGSTSFTVGPFADNTTESNNNNPEGFAVNLYEDLNRTILIASLTGLTVNDTSQTPSSTPSTFSFYYHAYGQDIEPTRVYFVETNNTIHLLASWGFAGQTHTSHSSAWTNVNLNLTAQGLSGKTGKIAFVQEIPSSFMGDTAVNGGIYTPGGGTMVDMRINASGGQAYWEHGWNIVGITNAATATGLTAVGSGHANGRWTLTTGSTGSVSTGPDNAYNNVASAAYIYLEASGGGSAGDYSVLRMKNNITIP